MTELGDLVPTTDELVRLRDVAAGRARPDLIVRGGLVLSPATDEWLECDVVVAGRHIAALTPWGRFPDAASEIDARGTHVVPGMLDAHLHIEYTNLTPGQLGRLSVPRGTTTVLTDPNAAANVWGVPGLDLMLETGTPLHVFHQVTPETPISRELERGGAVIEEAEVRDRLRAGATVTLGESNPFDFSRASTDRFRAALAAGRRMTGHTANQTQESLWGYLAAGIGDDHNASTIEQALERVRLGAVVTVMGASLTDNTVPLFSDVERIRPALRHLAFCADDKHALDLATQGHIDHHVRQAIRFGVDPIQAYRIATVQPAQYYRLDQVLGVLAPSRLADLLIVPDLAAVAPSVVVVAGEVVARDGVALFDVPEVIPDWARDSIRLPNELPDELFAVAAPVDMATVRVRAMEMYDGYFKRAFEAELPVVDGRVTALPRDDVLKIAVVDRHHGDALSGIGFVKGFGLRSGAIAITMNCANMNIAVVGTDDRSMRTAVEALREMGGGFVTVDGSEVLAEVRLPVGGMMSDAPFEETVEALASAHRITHDLGCPIESPYIVLSFVGLYVVPDYGVSELGLIDTATQSFVDVLLPGPADACG